MKVSDECKVHGLKGLQWPFIFRVEPAREHSMDATTDSPLHETGQSDGKNILSAIEACCQGEGCQGTQSLDFFPVLYCPFGPGDDTLMDCVVEF